MLTITFKDSGVTLLACKISGVSPVMFDDDIGRHYVKVYCDGITHKETSLSEKAMNSFRENIVDVLSGKHDEWNVL